jgi:hypothetical protein
MRAGFRHARDRVQRMDASMQLLRTTLVRGISSSRKWRGPFKGSAIFLSAHPRGIAHRGRTPGHVARHHAARADDGIILDHDAR